MGKHAEWRKLAKKLRRKRIRSAIASARDQALLDEQVKRERSPTYQAWLKEQSLLEQFKEAEEKRIAMERQRLWQVEEEAAMLRWREQQSRLAQAKAEKFKREIMIRQEWEREQKKIHDAEEARKKTEDEKKRKQIELLEKIDAFIEGKAELPTEANVSTQTQPGQPDCPFFSKTGACRFRDSCSRNHTRPGISRTLLITNFYDHFGLSTLHHDEYDTDLGLEYEDSETYQHFKEFYKDVFPEFEECGKVTMFKICNNVEPHLRGNVYVEFYSRRTALKAYRKFQGRFYAGKRLNVEFTSIPSWKNAICGLFHKQKCPKGKTCNFLHVFRNPNNAFKIHDGHSSSRRQASRSRSKSPPHRRRSRSKEWNWSGSDSENESRRKSRASHSKNKLNLNGYDSESDNDKKSRSKSPQRSKHGRKHESSKDRKRNHKQRSNEKHRSRSRSPHREKSSKAIVRDENNKEVNGNDEKYKQSKRRKEDDRKKYTKEKYEKDDYSKKHKRSNEKREKSRRRSPERS